VARNGQVSRWAEPICPQTDGLSPPFDAFVTTAIRNDAQRVGAPVNMKPGCAPNVEVIFTPEPQLLINRIAIRRSELLGFHYAAQARALAQVVRTIQAWYLTGTRGEGGDVVPDLDDQLALSDLSGNVLQAGSQPSGCAHSRLTHCSQSVFLNVLILVDAKQAGGRDIGPIADYVALLALSHSKAEDACGPLTSILDLLSAPCPGRPAPTGLTASDLAFLHGLYATDGTAEGAVQKASLADGVARDLERSAPAKP
jgi:hypothetical protein